MKTGKLYIKIFLSYFLALVVTEILIFVLFIHSERKITGYRLEQSTAIMVQMLEELIEEKIRWFKGIGPSAQEIEGLINRIGKVYEAKIWVKGADENPILKSFSGDIPSDLLSGSDMRDKNFGDITLYHDFGAIHRIYAFVPLKSPIEEKLTLHILFERKKGISHKWEFALWLTIIGVVIAILIIPVSRFITERVKQLRQSALQIAEGDLSHRVAVKGRDEIGELAVAFNRMTDKLEEMIINAKELTANVSHELRTPLTRIRIAEEMLRGKLEQGDLREYERHLDDIREDIGQLDSLIGRILDLSKLDLYESTLELETFNLSGLINELLARFQPIIERKGLSVKTDLSFDPPFTGDRGFLSVAFSNILDNAAKFAPEHGDIIIKMRSGQGALEISVTNSFKRLAEKDLARIFEPFHRAKRSNAAGSGLGLAITKKIIEKHGGNIEALNSPEGLTVLIRLPVHPAV